jgi:hypothetical protein
MRWAIEMNLEDGDEKDEKGQAKERIVGLYLRQLGEKSTDKCFVDLEVSVYSWTNSVSVAPDLLRREIDKKRYVLSLVKVDLL